MTQDDARPVVPPIHLTAGFENGGRHWYSRHGNPTVEFLEHELALWEAAPAAAVLPSGMAALAAVLSTTCRPGSRVVASSHLYPGTEVLLRTMSARGQMEAEFVDTADLNPEDLPQGDVLLLEVPSNPWLHVPAVGALAAVARSRGALTIVDSTLATPVYCRPLDLGADLVVHSLTKFASGSGDVLGGAVLGPDDLVTRIRDEAVRVGGSVTSPMTAHLLLRSLGSAELRIRTQSQHAAALVAKLQRQIDPALVRYPQPPGAEGDVTPFGAVVGLLVPDSSAFLELAHDRSLMVHAPSLGDTRTLISAIHPEAFPPATRATLEALLPRRLQLVRLSVGVQDPERLLTALCRLLS